ncbi:MAG: hypothetical protein V3U55_07215, partial [Mycobacterium sp.]
MAIAPINITRVSHNLRSMTLLSTLRRNSVDLFNQQVRLATGRNLITPSDDPVAASQAVKMRQVISRQQQILDNLRYADLAMSTADAALTEVNDLLNQAEAVASQSIGAQADAAEREANAAIIASIRERLTTVGNRQLRGSYIFAGRDTQSPPFVSALGGVAYLGDTGAVLTRVGRFDEEAVNVTGDVLFGALSASVGARSNLNAILQRETRLEDLTGINLQGIRKGTVVLSDSSGTEVQVDLSDADTVGDVMDMITAGANSIGVSAAVDIQGRGLVLTGGSLSIRDTANGVTASDLGIVAPAGRAATPAASGSAGGPPDLLPRITPNTTLDSLGGGNGIPLDGSIRITNGNQTAAIDLSDAVTIQDITNRINNAGLFVVARINDAGTGIEIASQVSGIHLSISDDGGTTASALGLRTMDASTPLASLNFGSGVHVLAGQADLVVSSRAGTSFEVNLDGAVTVGDVIALI